MTVAGKRKTSQTLDAEALDLAKSYGVSVSAVAEAALLKAVTEARQAKCRDENAAAFAAQADWHNQNGHPLAEIITAPGGTSRTN